MTCYRLVVCRFHKKELSPPKNKICIPHCKTPRYVKVLRNNGKKISTRVCMHAQLHLIFFNFKPITGRLLHMPKCVFNFIFNFLCLTHPMSFELTTSSSTHSFGRKKCYLSYSSLARRLDQFMSCTKLPITMY